MLWQELPLSWSSKPASRIPSDWFVVEQRQSKASGENRNASHPVNAILNYGYAVLESQARIASAMLGFDTSVSCLQAMKHGRPSLIFDLIEPLRLKLDRRRVVDTAAHPPYPLVEARGFEPLTCCMQSNCSPN